MPSFWPVHALRSVLYIPCFWHSNALCSVTDSSEWMSAENRSVLYMPCFWPSNVVGSFRSMSFLWFAIDLRSVLCMPFVGFVTGFFYGLRSVLYIPFFGHSNALCSVRSMPCLWHSNALCSVLYMPSFWPFHAPFSLPRMHRHVSCTQRMQSDDLTLVLNPFESTVLNFRLAYLSTFDDNVFFRRLCFAIPFSEFILTAKRHRRRQDFIIIITSARYTTPSFFFHAPPFQGRRRILWLSGGELFESRTPAGKTREKSGQVSLVSAPQSPDVNVALAEADEIKNVRDDDDAFLLFLQKHKQHAQSRTPAGKTREKSEQVSLVSATQSPDVNVALAEADEIKNVRDNSMPRAGRQPGKRQQAAVTTALPILSLQACSYSRREH
jgi:hypothetical protein